MTWEQKMAAMQSLCGHFDICLRMRAPGDWYVAAAYREVKSGGMLVGLYGNGSTPQEAVEDDWHRVVEGLQPGEYIILHAGTDDRRAVQWNGYMWEQLEERHATV